MIDFLLGVLVGAGFMAGYVVFHLGGGFKKND